MNNFSDDFLLIGLGALAFAFLYQMIRRAYHAAWPRIRAVHVTQFVANMVAATRNQRALHGEPSLNQVAADTPAAPRAASANP